MKFLLPSLLLFAALCLSPTVYATSVGTLDGSPVNFPPGMLVENRAFVSPYMLVTLLFTCQLGGLILIGLPLLIYRALRRRWPQSAAARHRAIVTATTVAVVLAAFAIMRSGGTMKAGDFMLPLVGSLAGYAVMALADFVIVRRIWQRFTRLPRWLRPVTVFLLPLFLAWLVVQAQQALIRATMTTYAYPPPLPVPQFREGTPTPPQPNAPPDQPPASPPPHLTLPPEALQ